MASWWNDFVASVLQGLSIPPEQCFSGIIGEYVDMQGAQEGLFATLHIGAVSGSSPTLDVTLEEADDAAALNNQSIIDFITGQPAAFAQKTAADADTMLSLNFKRSKRFVRAVAATGGGSPSFFISVPIHGMRRRVL